MGKRIDELEQDLQSLKMREEKVREEMVSMQTNATNKRATKKARAHKMFLLAEMIMEHCGEGVLEHRDELEQFLIEHHSEFCILNPELNLGYRAELLMQAAYDEGTIVSEN